MSTLNLRLLGPPCIEIDDQPLTFGRRKSLALLAHLAVKAEAQPRDTLATLLWPHSGQRQARGLLRRELSALKHTLADGWLTSTGDMVSLPLGQDVQLDVRAFNDLLNADTENAPDLSRLAAAVDLYRGDFLAGFTLDDCPDFDDWQFFQAEGYRLSLLHALDRLVNGHSGRREWQIAIDYARRRLALDPLHEPIQRALIRLYALTGQAAAALHQYQECKDLLYRELGAPPEAETTDLYEAVRTRRFPPAEQAPPLPLAVVSSPRHNLRLQPTSFVGRQEEIAAVLERLTKPECRLLTIVGPGGVGKTRLALSAAEQALEHFAGVYLVPLVGVEDLHSLPGAIADALSLPASTAGAGRRDHLLAYLCEQELLLVLDNFEHLVEGAEFLAKILTAAPRVKIMVTSRQPLNLHEEWRYPLHGLPYPDTNTPIEGIVYPALELFRQRAVQIDPDFSLAHDISAVAAICRQLEGMPLGIELAAALVRVLSPAQIDEELSVNIDILSTSARNMPVQHRSLRAVFERSWQLLTEQEQAALRSLSVFRGSFDREAALVVADLTLPALTDLVDRSLVRRVPSDRYDLHELMRQFVSEKLDAMPGEQKATSQRHCRHFCERLSRMAWVFEPEKQPDGFFGSVLLQQVGVDLDNYRAAWQWAVTQVDTQAIRQAMSVLAEYGTLTEGWPLFDEAVTAVQAAEGLPAAEAEALSASLILRRSWIWRWDRLPEWAEMLSRSLAMLRRSDPENYVDIGANLIWLGATLASLGKNDEGATLIDEGIQLFGRHEHESGKAWGLNFRGLLEAGRGRLLTAREFLEQSLALFASCKNWKWRAVAREGLADVALLQGNFELARRLYEQSVVEDEAEGKPEVMKCLGETYTALGEFARAEACFARAEALFTRQGIPYGMSLAYMTTPGVLARLRGDLAEAERLLVGTLTTIRQVGYDQRIATSLHNLARLRHDQQRYTEAISLLAEALAVSRRVDFRFATALTLCQLGHTASALNQPEAGAYYAEALQITLDDEIDRVATDTIRGMAKQLATSGRLEDAVALLALIVDHPASDYETRQKAQALLSELAAEVPPDRYALAIHQGHQHDLHQVAEQLLREEFDSTCIKPAERI